jgi:radical SAM protein with 4Fe4S-binding SPASM domain
MASNIHELPAMVDLCAELGATGVHVEPLYAQPGSADLVDHYGRENLGAARTNVAAILDHAARRADDLGVTLATRFAGERSEFDYVRRARNERVDWTCSEPWSSIWVTSAGEVRTCCSNETSFGSLFERTIEEIWNGREYRAFRQQHVRRETATGCSNCMANGRVRQSPFFRPIESVTYRPLVFAAAPASDVVIDLPRAGATVTDPLIVTGRCHGSPAELELMVDNTAVANFNDLGFFQGLDFVLEVPVEFVTEGAHVLWARPRGASEGWGHRTVFLWRPSAGVTTHAVFAVPRCMAPLPPTLSIGGHRWDHADWKTMHSARGMMMVAVADVSTLPPGEYGAEVRLVGRVVTERRLQRLPA